MQSCKPITDLHAISFQFQHEVNLVTRSAVESANIIYGMTPAQRIRPVLTAILSQVELNASKYHDFVAILEEFNPELAGILCRYFCKFTYLCVLVCMREYVLVELLLLLVPKTKKFDLNMPNGFSFQRSMVLIGSK